MKNLKKLVNTTILLIFILISFISCSTSVSVSYLKPAKYDLTKYKHLAIASMKVSDAPVFPDSFVDIRYDDVEERVYTGYEYRMPFFVAEDFTQSLYLDLYKTSYFDIVKPSITDVYLENLNYGINTLSKLRDLGVQALLVSQIDYFDYEEYPLIGDYIQIENPEYDDDPTLDRYIDSDEREVKIIQQAHVKYSYKVIDINTGEIIASNSYNKTVNNEVDFTDRLVTLPSMKSLFEEALLSGEKLIVKDLSPQYVTANITLKKDKKADSYFNDGMDAVSKGSLRVAFDNFNISWQDTKSFAAGYNSALVKEALGDRESAITIMKEVYSIYPEIDAYNQLSRMEQYKFDTNVAQSQIYN